MSEQKVIGAIPNPFQRLFMKAMMYRDSDFMQKVLWDEYFKILKDQPEWSKKK